MSTRYRTVVDSPVGALTLASDGRSLVGLYFDAGRSVAPCADARIDPDAWPFAIVRAQLGEYFAGSRRQFELPLDPFGTDFHRRVWSELRAIPFGATRSYGQIARLLGQPGAMRAVGLANGRNPIAIIVPCHRVIGADGSLTGFGGGLERKRWLLAHEGVMTRPLDLAARAFDPLDAGQRDREGDAALGAVGDVGGA
jgi:methylated-DNA-[protein]-cysteine S-methyltransferase